MLRKIAVFTMQGRWQSAVAAALLTVASFILPPLSYPLSYLASGIIVLSSLRMGPMEGAKVLAAAVVIFAMLAGLILGNLWVAAGMMLLSVWLPVFIVTLVLGYTRSLAAGFTSAAGLGVLFIVGMHLFIPEQGRWWWQFLSPLVDTLRANPNWKLSAQDTVNVVSAVAKLMTGLVAAGITINAIIGLIVGRAWQAKLDNKGAFATEFCRLRLGKMMATITILLMVVALSPLRATFGILVDCLFVMLSLFAVQGLAVVHSIVRARQRNKFWVIGVYILLAFMLPQMLVLLATLGVVEQWFNFRKHSIE